MPVPEDPFRCLTCILADLHFGRNNQVINAITFHFRCLERMKGNCAGTSTTCKGIFVRHYYKDNLVEEDEGSCRSGGQSYKRFPLVSYDSRVVPF